MATKARMIPILILMATSLFNTEESIATPCSVNANGIYRVPPRLFEVTNCDLKCSNSSLESSNMKSIGNLFLFLLTDCFKTFVSIPYISAKSKSSITRCPLISYILLCICSSWFMEHSILCTACKNKKLFRQMNPSAGTNTLLDFLTTNYYLLTTDYYLPATDHRLQTR